MPQRMPTDPISDALAAHVAAMSPLLPETFLHQSPAEVLQKWTRDVAREQINLYLVWTGAALRCMRALCTAQIAAGEQSDHARGEATARLNAEPALEDIADIQVKLGNDATEGIVRYWTNFDEALMRSALEAATDVGTGVLRLLQAIGSLGNQMLGAKLPESTQAMQAEVEHVLNPIASSPLVWPTQEAARAAFTATATAWNDLLNWSGQLTQASQSMLGINGSAAKHL